MLTNMVHVLVAALGWEDLHALHSLVWQEMNKRTQKYARDGKYPELSEDEKNSIKRGEIILACKSYNQRHKSMKLLEARAVAENYRNTLPR